VTGPGGHADTAYLLDASGPAAPPRDNGELTFAAPWESQAFGLALALHEAGWFDWEDFRQQLITEIAIWEVSHAAANQGWSYYACWLSALEQLVIERGLVGGDDVRVRASMIAARPPDHGPPGHWHDDAPDSAGERADPQHAARAPSGASHAD
jgi:nitrile hydratase accessory protein